MSSPQQMTVAELHDELTVHAQFVRQLADRLQDLAVRAASVAQQQGSRGNEMRMLDQRLSSAAEELTNSRAWLRRASRDMRALDEVL